MAGIRLLSVSTLMRVRLLGTAAGGGFPQWNCNCENCAGLRAGRVSARARTQSSAAVSADGRRWFLLNASPDITAQIAAFPPIGPPANGKRGTGIEGILLTNSDLDHTLGLFQLREGAKLNVYANGSTREDLDAGLSLTEVLSNYCGVAWHEPPALKPSEKPATFGKKVVDVLNTPIGPTGVKQLTTGDLRLRDGSASGLVVGSFELPSNAPRYSKRSKSRSLGYRIADSMTGGVLIFVPDMGEWQSDFAEMWAGADLILIDGTFWSDDEMAKTGTGTLRASQMGHVPVGGPGGTLTKLAAVEAKRKVLIHINNTNPVLREDSPERAEVVAAGVTVGEDGMEFAI